MYSGFAFIISGLKVMAKNPARLSRPFGRKRKKKT